MGSEGLSGRLGQVLALLENLSRLDANPWSGRMFTHTYDPGIPELHEATWKAFKLYRDKTMLDFTVYPSIVVMERELLGFLGPLFHAPEGYSGSFTYGGTESIILAALAAREAWKRRGGGGEGKIVMPVTGHPAFAKAAYLLGLRVERVPVDRETMEADPGVVAERVDGDTVMVVASAVNYPYGSLDPVPGIAEALEGKDAWLHVDACIGGMVLAFAREAGEDIVDFDFLVDRVRSLSVDMHKYGYSPKGASVVLFRGKEDKKPTLFVDASWPGYPLVNEAVLSTRSAAPLAAAWAVARLLGREGYRLLAARVVEARRRIQKGLESMGFDVIGRPRAGILAFTSSQIDVLELASRLSKAGWLVQVQPGSRPLGFPPSIHLTISPVHLDVVDEFLAALDEARRGIPAPELRAERILADKGLSGVAETVEKVGKEGLDEEAMRLVDELIYMLDPELVNELIREAVLEIFKPLAADW
jgi:glutamate/tyrosine decarboxylase-like PLP-dependent enzyme